MQTKVEEKFDVVLRIFETLKPGQFKLVFPSYQDSAVRNQVIALVEKLMPKKVSPIIVMETTVISLLFSDSEKGISIVFDSCIPESCYNASGWFSVFLVEPGETEGMKQKGVRELDALFYYSYRGLFFKIMSLLFIMQFVIQGSKSTTCLYE